MKNTTKLNCTTTLGTNVPEQRIIEQSSVSSVKITAKNIEGFKEWLISEDRCTGTICMVLGIFSACIIAGIRVNKRNLDLNNLFVIAACTIGIAILGAKILFVIVTYGLEKVLVSLLHFDSTVWRSPISLCQTIPPAMIGVKCSEMESPPVI